MSVWGDRYAPSRLLAMISAYFDESYDKGFMVVCGWIATVEQWRQFEIDWKLFLASYKVPYFHMTDFAHSVGPYKKWKDASYIRDMFLRDAWRVIRPCVQSGCAVCLHDVHLEWTDRLYHLQEKFHSTYAIAGRTSIDWAESFARYYRDEVRCVFDAGGPDKGGLIAATDVAPIASNPIFEPSRDTVDRKRGFREGAVQIQSADFLAYEISKYIREMSKGNRNVRRSLRRMLGQKHGRLMLFNEEAMAALCRHFQIAKRPQKAR